MKISVGTAVDRDPLKAIDKAALECREKPNFALVFATSNVTAKCHKALLAINKEIKWAGCTARAFTDKGEGDVGVMLLHSPYMFFGVGTSPEKSIDDIKVDKYVDPYIKFTAMKKKKVADLVKVKSYSVLVFVPGPTQNYYPKDNEFLDEIAGFTGVCPLLGGSADPTIKDSCLFANGKAVRKGVIVTVSTNLITHVDFWHNMEPEDGFHMVTKSKGNIVYELDNKPAGEFYREGYGFGAKDLDGSFTIFVPYIIKKHLVFSDPIRQNLPLYLMKPRKLKPKIKNDYIMICVNSHLRDRVKIKRKHIGFYSYGELVSLERGAFAKQNQTFAYMGIKDKLVSE